MAVRKRSPKPPVTIDVGPDDTLDTIRAQVFTLLHQGKALICPCCGQHAMVCKRPITKAMAVQLKMLALRGPLTTKQLQPTTHGSWRLYSLLRFWDFVRHCDDEKNTWAITQSGMSFVAGHVKAARFMYVYNNTVLWYSPEEVDYTFCTTQKWKLEDVFSTTTADLAVAIPR